MSQPFVLDASLTMSWCFEDERTPATDQAATNLLSTFAEAPALLYYEVQNILRIAERKGRIQGQRAERFWTCLQNFDIRLESAVMTSASLLLSLARTHDLTAYDAAYLELAMRKQLPLGTLDGKLRAAAVRSGVTLLL